MSNCITCNKKLVGKQTKYCSDKCSKRDNYLKHKKEYIERARKWDMKNPIKSRESNKKALNKFRIEKGEKVHELMRNQYTKNKNKFYSRNLINFLLKRNRINLIKECKKCGSKENLEIHHEIYPTTSKEIINLANNRIYFVCKICHKKCHKKL